MPLLIWGLDLEAYGLYMAILGVVATANLFDFGLHYGVLNAVSAARGRDDDAAVERIVATAFLIYSAIVAAVLLLVVPLLFLIPMDRLLGVTPEQAPLASQVALLAFAGLLVPMPFKVFSGALAKDKGVVKAMRVPGGAEKMSRKVTDGYSEFVKTFRAGGAPSVKYTANGYETGIAKFVAPVADELEKRLGLEEGDIVLFTADTWSVATKAMGELRIKVAADLDLEPPVDPCLRRC